MAKSVKLRQGTDTEHAAFTGEMAEVTFDTTNNTIILHDGTTAGGIPMAKLSDVPVDLTDLTDVDGNLVGGISFSGTTYVVTVASGTNAYSTGNKYYITDLADASPTVTLTEGVTYRFDQSDSTNTGHPLKFSTTADGTHDSGIEYTTGVTYNGVPGQTGAYTEITVEVGAPTLYYYCANHSGMGTSAPGVEIVTSSLVWHLDAANSSSYSGSGTTWFDLVGSEDASLVTNAPTYSTEGGGSFYFNGINSRMSTTYNPSFDEWSASVWFKPEEGDGTWGWFMNTFTSGSSGEWWALGFDYSSGGNGLPTWMVDNNSTKRTISSDTIATSDWQMMTGTRQGSTMTLYINGIQVATTNNLNTSTVTPGSSIRLGAISDATDQFYKGYISDLKLYSKMLSQTEVLQNYNALKDRYTVAPAPAATPMWSLSGDSESFAAVSTSKLDTSAASYVALNNPTGWGNIWAMVDGSWVIRNNPTSLDGPVTKPLNIWSTDDLSEGMTYQFWIKFDANQPAMWEGLAGIKTDDPTTSYNYAHWQTSSNQLGWGANSVYGYYVHPGNNTVNQPSGEALSSYGWIHIAVELQSNGRIVHYFDGEPVINVSAGDVSTRTEKANFHFGSVNSCVTDIEVYTGGGIHNPDLLETPPGFTPSARKTADTSNASVSANLMWSLSGDSDSFAAVSTSKLDTSAASYVALNHPSGRGNAWALEDGSYALRNNSNLVNDPGTRPLHIWSTDDLSDGMTTQYWIKFDANQPAMWEALHSIEAGSSQAHSYSISLAAAVHTLAWAGNGAYGYFGHTSNGSSSFPDQGWLHIAEELQSNGRQVIYINGVVVVNESASDLFGLTNKANLRIGSVSSWMTDIEVYTGGGIHNPDLLETPPGFTPPARKTAPIPIVTSSLVWHVDAANPSSYSGSGSTWSDLIGSEDVDLIGSPTYSADEGGGAFNFVAGSSYGKTSFTRTNDDFSVSAWYKPNDPQSSNQGYYNLMNTFESSSAEWWSLSLLGPSPRPFWVCDNDSAKIELWADGGTVNSTWQMITGTRSGNTMKIYVNGTLQGTSTALTSSAISGVEPIWIASRSNEDTGSPSETYGGWISDLKMYSKELSDSEVLQNYNALKDRYT